MSKRGTVRPTRIPRVVESDQMVHGSAIVLHSLPAAALAVDRLSAITANLGAIEAGDIWLGGPLGSFLHIGNAYAGGAPYLILEFAAQGGRRLLHLRGDATPAITLGPAPVGGEPPVRVYEDRMEIDPDVLVTGTLARTLLTGDYIWVGSEKTPLSHPGDPDVTGMLLDGTGLWGYRGGQAQAGLGGSGRLVAGERGQIALDRQGLWALVDQPRGGIPASDVGLRFFGEEGVGILGGLLADTAVVQGHPHYYLNLYLAGTADRYVEAGLLVLNPNGVLGGLRFATGGPQGPDIFGSLWGVRQMDFQSADLVGVGRLTADRVWGHLCPDFRPYWPWPGELAAGELAVARQGDVVRLYYSLHEGMQEKLYYVEMTEVTG